MESESLLALLALFVSVLSVGIAVWQGVMSRAQLRLAQTSERNAAQSLEEVRRVTGETKQLVQDVKANIDDRITKILDSRLAAEQQTQQTTSAASAALMQAIIGGLGRQQGKEPPTVG